MFMLISPEHAFSTTYKLYDGETDLFSLKSSQMLYFFPADKY